MKTTLLLLLLFAGIAGFAQHDINYYYAIAPGEADGYTVVTSATDLDEATAGPNLTWNFTGLTTVGYSSVQAQNPSATELLSYPGTTTVVSKFTDYTGGSQILYDKIFLRWDGPAASITGIIIPEVSLSYTDNGFLGTFPLEYGYDNTDNIAGSFVGYGTTGTFTGTVETAVDAYGLFSQNSSSITTNRPVTRLKVTQQVTLNAMGFQVGTATQTTYNYYDEIGNLVFRSTTTTVLAPFIGINDTTSVYEVYSATLGVNTVAVNNTVIAPNPVADVLHLSGDAAITGITITDISGRVVLKSAAANDFLVSHLSAGVYNVAVESGSGNKSLKMIKS